MAVATIDGVDLWYDFIGPADATSTIVTVHGGLGFDHKHMARSFARLAGGDTRVLVYDQRANGASTGDPATITMERLADDLAGLLDHLGVGPAVVLGHSFGGFVAQEFALRHPARVAALVLVDTTPGQLGTGEVPDEHGVGPPPPPEWMAALATPPASDEELASGMPALLRFYLADHGPDNPRLADLQALVEGTVTRVAPMTQGFMALNQWSAVDRLPAISAPTLVLVGRHDQHTAWPQSYRIASRVPNAEVVIFENSGHFPWVEEPERFFAVLEAWLAASK